MGLLGINWGSFLGRGSKPQVKVPARQVQTVPKPQASRPAQPATSRVQTASPPSVSSLDSPTTVTTKAALERRAAATTEKPKPLLGKGTGDETAFADSAIIWLNQSQQPGDPLSNTVVVNQADQGTKTDIPVTSKPSDRPSEVTTESGTKLKLSGGGPKIEKTREDTSRAAADILKRTFQRRPKI